jgi:hypothetical protein
VYCLLLRNLPCSLLPIQETCCRWHQPKSLFFRSIGKNVAIALNLFNTISACRLKFMNLTNLSLLNTSTYSLKTESERQISTFSISTISYKILLGIDLEISAETITFVSRISFCFNLGVDFVHGHLGKSNFFCNFVAFQ